MLVLLFLLDRSVRWLLRDEEAQEKEKLINPSFDDDVYTIQTHTQKKSITNTSGVGPSLHTLSFLF